MTRVELRPPRLWWLPPCLWTALLTVAAIGSGKWVWIVPASALFLLMGAGALAHRRELIIATPDGLEIRRGHAQLFYSPWNAVGAIHYRRRQRRILVLGGQGQPAYRLLGIWKMEQIRQLEPFIPVKITA